MLNDDIGFIAPLFIPAVLTSLLRVTPIQASRNSMYTTTYDFAHAGFREFMYATKYDYADADFQEFMYATIHDFADSGFLELYLRLYCS